MDDALSDQLALGCVPYFIMSVSISDLLKGVGRPFVISMFGKGDFGPVWYRVVIVMLWVVKGVVETKFAPCDDLIEEGFE